MKDNDLMYSEVKYSDIVANWHNKDWEGWKECCWIVSNIPNSRKYLTGMERVKLFTNTYLLERAVAAKLGLSFNSDEHEALHPGWGKPSPDFHDDNDITYELKSSYSRECAPHYSHYCWWNAQVHLLYERSTGHLFIQHYDDYTDLGIIEFQELK